MVQALDAPNNVVGVVGSGAMGAGIAQVAALAGHPVKLYDVIPNAAIKAIAGIQTTFGKLVEKGKLSSERAADAAMRLKAVDALDQLGDASLVVEAIVENLDAKRKLFADLEDIVGDECILATNTSSISVTAIGAKLRRPQRLAGMHFFNPVPLMALVEVVSGLATDENVADMVFATAAAWGKSPVHTTSTPGFIVNRVARPFYAEALRVATEQSARPATLDAIMREAGGFRMGPFELMDLIGHDVNFAVTCSVFAAYFNDQRFTPSLMQQELVSAGFLGRKTGRGFYQYGEGAPSIAVESEAMQTAPSYVVIHGQGARIKELLSKAAASIKVERSGCPGVEDALLECGGATLYLTDGRTATSRAHHTNVANTVLVDLALDFSTASRVALARADQCSDAAFNAVVGFFQACGVAVSRIDDIPGMIVMRTVAMLVNEASDAVNQGVCDAQAVDIAMLKGVNYPKGPLAWADSIGLDGVVTVLDNLAAAYGEDRYRVSPMLRRKVHAGVKFHG